MEIPNSVQAASSQRTTGWLSSWFFRSSGLALRSSRLPDSDVPGDDRADDSQRGGDAVGVALIDAEHAGLQAAPILGRKRDRQAGQAGDHDQQRDAAVRRGLTG